MRKHVNQSQPRGFARRVVPAIMLALALVLNACLPAPAPPARFRAPAVESGEVWIGGNGPVRVLSSVPPIPFEVVSGGADDPTTYRARAGELTAHYGPAGVAYAVVGRDPAEGVPETAPDCHLRLGRDADRCTPPGPSQRWWLSQELVGARLAPPAGVDPAETVVSVFVGPAGDWQTGLPTYQRLAYGDAWPGVDLVYDRSGPRGLKATYHLAPGADPRVIRLLWRGADARIDEDGSLVLATPLGELRESPPVAWQDVDGQRRPVAARFEIVSWLPGDAATAETEVAFVLGAYDPAHPLVIDPTLLYASYIGGSSDDQGWGIASDGTGAIYVSGQTASTHSTFPNGNGLAPLGVPGFDKSVNGGATDAFVMKLNPDATTVAYATFVGGNGDERASSIAVDASGAAYVVGHTSSREATFPVANGVPGFDQSYNGGLHDVFALKLAPSGASLNYVSYLGGVGDETGAAIALDASGAAFVTGVTVSDEASFPDGAGLVGRGLPGFDQTFNGARDAFVVKVASDGRSVLYATFLGGSEIEHASAIAVGDSGSAYVVGFAESTQTTFPNGSGLAGLGISGFDQTFNGGPNDAFAVKLSPDGRSLAYATYLGGDDTDHALRVAVDPSEAAYVLGTTQSTEWTFPDGDPNTNDRIDAPGFDQTHNTGADTFLVKLVPDGSSLAFATYLGGSGEDAGSAIAVGPDRSVYVAGYTSSTQSTFPNGAGLGGLGLPGFDQTYNGGDYDGFAIKLAPTGTSLTYATYLGGDGFEIPIAMAVDQTGLASIVGFTRSTEATFPDGDPNANDRIDVPSFDRSHNSGDDAFVVKVGPAATSTPTPTPTSTPLPTSTPPPTSTLPPTSTPPPTSTLPPTPTATVQPGRCAPRPNVQVVTAPLGDGRLRATLRAQTLPATQPNALSSLRVNGLANARVSLGGTVLSQGQAVPLAQGTQEAVLLVERVTPGQAATLQLVVTDACGEWPTLLGGGLGAF